jgi:hypothetical protein
LSSIELEKRADCGQTSDFFLEERRFMERRFLPLWVLVAPRNPNPQASLRISLLDEEDQAEKPIAFWLTHNRDSSVLLAVQFFDGSTSPIVFDLGPQFLSLSVIMELSVEILIVGALIYFGWNKPFKQIRAIG